MTPMASNGTDESSSPNMRGVDMDEDACVMRTFDRAEYPGGKNRQRSFLARSEQPQKP